MKPSGAVPSLRNLVVLDANIWDETLNDVDFKGLGSEGRAAVFDFGLFMLIGVYCLSDNKGTEDRINTSSIVTEPWRLRPRKRGAGGHCRWGLECVRCDD